MTDSLSPAARRIRDAANRASSITSSVNHKIAAAVLRATAQIVASEAASNRRKIRAELLDLAAELEGCDGLP